jgi:acyl carrier protein
MIAAMSLWPRLAAILEAQAPSPPSEIRQGSRLIDDLGFDSLALAKTVVALEAEFGTELPADRLHELRSATAGDLLAMLTDSLAA